MKRLPLELIAALVLTVVASTPSGAGEPLPRETEPPPALAPGERPGAADSEANADYEREDLPAHAPQPTEKPKDEREKADDEDREVPPERKKPARITATPAAEKACRARLRALKVTFEEAEPLADPAGCVAPNPLTVSAFADGIALEPPATLNCAMAEATARFLDEQLRPLVREEFDADIARIAQMSSYVCRPRNGSRKLSEHAFANALDIGAIHLEDGTEISVRAYQRTEPRRSRLIAAIREAACGPFKTVLGPGSDADHADHFHFDLAQRRNGGTFCQ